MSKINYHQISVILADDHEIFRDGFRAMLEKQEDIKLIGEAESGRELVELVEKLKPDVVITDIKMPIMDGIEATRTLVEKIPGIKIIALSMFDDDYLIVDMIEAGAKGYLLKNAPKPQVIEAIKAVYEDSFFYCRAITNKLSQLISKTGYNPHKRSGKVDLGEKEKEIIKFICQELSSKEIGEKLNLSERTIEGYRHKIQDKLGVKNSIGVVMYAIRNGLHKM